jgi:hypothetical protein
LQSKSGCDAPCEKDASTPDKLANPLFFGLETYKHAHPILGAILGGVFTDNSLTQLKSRGFLVVYVPYQNVLAAFAKVGIDADYGERTAEAEYAKKISQYRGLSSREKATLQKAIVSSVDDQLEVFEANLRNSLSRSVERILILPLHGKLLEVTTLDDALTQLSLYSDDKGSVAPLSRYEIEIRYNNGAVIRGSYPSKGEAIAFLRDYAS